MKMKMKSYKIKKKFSKVTQCNEGPKFTSNCSAEPWHKEERNQNSDEDGN
jgi:hypothetical protein